MDRRALLFTGLAALATPVVPTARAASDIKVIYVGGWDCPPCTTWKNNNKATWLASPEHRRVTYVEVDAPRLKEAYQERYWPGELKPILDQLPRKSGTPRFLIVRDGQVVANEFGASKWTNIVAELRTMLG
jgi:hypothetical protein